MRKRKKGCLKLQINNDTHSNQSNVPVEGVDLTNPVYEGNNNIRMFSIAELSKFALKNHHNFNILCLLI